MFKCKGFIDHDILKYILSCALGAFTSYAALYNSVSQNTFEIQSAKGWMQKTEAQLEKRDAIIDEKLDSIKEAVIKLTVALEK